MLLKLEARPAPSVLMSYLSPICALVLTIVVGLLIFWLLGKNPLIGFETFFINPLKSAYAWSELLLKSVPLMLCAVGLAIGFRANVWNIGAEGQFIMGATAAAAFALYFETNTGYIYLCGMMLSGALGGALWAAIPAWLRCKFNTNEILVTLMLVYVAQLMVSWLVFGPMKDPEGMNFPQSKLFTDTYVLPLLIEGTRLNISLLITLAMLLTAHFFMQFSYSGFKMRVAGEAPAAALYAGYSAHKTIWLGLICGGAAAGLAGMFEVAGPMGQLTDKVGSGYGFAAIIVAYVGRLKPLGIIFASLIMALFFIGGEQVQQHMNLPSSLSKVFQGMLLFFLLAMDLFINYRLRLGKFFLSKS